MTICNELYEIASAYYGLQLKDPIYYALAKLVEDPKFGLLQDMFNDDPADFDTNLDYYFYNKNTCALLTNFSKMIYILNGRKAFYGPNEPESIIDEPDEDTVIYWISVLGNELMHSGNKMNAGIGRYGITWEGDGQINGSRIRAAIFHILDILSRSNNVCYTEPTIMVESPFCFFGKDFDRVVLTGKKGTDMGYLNPEDNKYYIDVVIKDIFSENSNETRITKLIGDHKLEYGSILTCNFPSGTSFGHSFYQISVMEKDKEVNSKMTLIYNALRDTVSANPDDYEYELYNNNTLARTLLYKGSDEVLAVPEKFEGAPTRKLGPFTYAGMKIKKIYVVDGIKVIE